MMPDTSEAREAIRKAYECHRDVMGGMSMALLKLEAASGLYDNELDPETGQRHPPHTLPAHILINHAGNGLAAALAACDMLRAALVAAADETAKLEAHRA
jgi:hypothetical protein